MKESKITNEMKRELDIRLDNHENGRTKLYSWLEVKSHIAVIRQS